jgi:phosphatidylserine/phosphatidylglycerophosphate/cardiolipin synthase-like enzyme
MKAIVLFSMIFVFFATILGAEINVYFTHSVDTTYANTTPAQGNVELDKKLINRIVQAQYSIDFCFYDIERQNIVDSLISAFNQGVEVRVITECDNYYVDTLGNIDTTIQKLIDANIPVIHDTFGYQHGSKLMHNKFAIFDFRDSSSVDDDWIWTGSYNITDNGTISNANNAVEIQEQELARAYTVEFEEMWGSNTNIPDSANAKFSYHKEDNTEHNFLIDSIPVELYFSPSDHPTAHICSCITTADSTIYFCIFSFTHNDVRSTMRDRWDAGVWVRGVFDQNLANQLGGEYEEIKSWHDPPLVYTDSVQSGSGPKRLHHKYMLVDSDYYSDTDPIVITGSQNWSAVAEDYNDENTLIIHSQDIANQYLQEFIVRYREAGGQYGCLEKSNDLSLNKIRIFPNPFTNRLRIEGCSKINVYDISGKFVAEFKREWDGKDINGEEVSAGIYFLRFKRENIGKVLKLRRGL